MASISRFGRAISPGNSASDNSFASSASVSSAVLSRRLSKSGVVPVIKGAPKQGSKPKIGRTIVDATARVNCAQSCETALIGLENQRNYRDLVVGPGNFPLLASQLSICA